jgi:hypothetical protein
MDVSLVILYPPGASGGIAVPPIANGWCRVAAKNRGSKTHDNVIIIEERCKEVH